MNVQQEQPKSILKKKSQFDTERTDTSAVKTVKSIRFCFEEAVKPSDFRKVSNVATKLKKKSKVQEKQNVDKSRKKRSSSQTNLREASEPHVPKLNLLTNENVELFKGDVFSIDSINTIKPGYESTGNKIVGEPNKLNKTEKADAENERECKNESFDEKMKKGEHGELPDTVENKTDDKEEGSKKHKRKRRRRRKKRRRKQEGGRDSETTSREYLATGRNIIRQNGFPKLDSGGIMDYR
ncbi:hypothetical protein RUM43_006828 [Polyplax serrata]|uniref:Uncharacterized protein n=1 Tax=Polyplax serrata TaxID=468196 RepID=A0AAN8PBM8_POLSC